MQNILFKKKSTERDFSPILSKIQIPKNLRKKKKKKKQESNTQTNRLIFRHSVPRLRQQSFQPVFLFAIVLGTLLNVGVLITFF